MVSSIPWHEVRLTPAPAVTPKEGEPAPKTEDEHLKDLLRIHRMDPRPTLLYFHYPHEDLEKPGVAGRASKKLCEMLADETFARWGLLVRCVEVDAEKSDARILERLGVGTGPSFSLVNEKLEVVAKSGPFATSKGAAAFLKQNVTAGFPDFWKVLQERIDAQKALIAEGRALAKQKKFDEALARYDAVVFSDLRIADFFEDACREAEDVAAAAAKAQGRR